MCAESITKNIKLKTAGRATSVIPATATATATRTTTTADPLPSNSTTMHRRMFCQDKKSFVLGNQPIKPKKKYIYQVFYLNLSPNMGS